MLGLGLGLGSGLGSGFGNPNPFLLVGKKKGKCDEVAWPCRLVPCSTFVFSCFRVSASDRFIFATCLFALALSSPVQSSLVFSCLALSSLV